VGYRDARGAHLEILYFVGLFATTSYLLHFRKVNSDILNFYYKTFLFSVSWPSGMTIFIKGC
jgi:hypothetical protein